MATYTFETITAAQALAFNAATDVLTFTSASYSAQYVWVSFDDAAQTYTIHAVNTSRAVTFGSAAFGLVPIFSDGSTLFIGTSGADSIAEGSSKTDLLYGHGGNDTLAAGFSGDTLEGGAGNDVLTGGKGADALWGGAGSDIFVIATGDSTNSEPDMVRDWEAGDRLAFPVAATSGDYLEITSIGASYEGMKALADERIATGTYNYVAVDSGTGVYVFADTRGDNGSADDVVLLAHANLGSLDAGSIIGGATPPPATGADTLVGDSGANSLNGGDGNDQLRGQEGADTLLGGAGADTLEGGEGGDVLVGGSGPDRMTGGAGDDVFTFAAGDNGVQAEALDTIVDWQAGDWLRFPTDSTGADYAETTAGSYGEALSAANSLIASGTHNFVAVGIGSNVVVFADSRGDNGGADDAVLLQNRSLFDVSAGNLSQAVVSNGPDTLNGASGDDALDGRAGDDVIRGGPGADTLSGADGDDVLAGDDGNDSLAGGAGHDTVTYATASGGVVASLALWSPQTVGGGQGVDTLRDVERLTGSPFADQLTGSFGVDTLVGGAGDDTIRGLESGDSLSGGDGQDNVSGIGRAGGVLVIAGGNGDDTVSGSIPTSGSGGVEVHGGPGNDLVSAGFGLGRGEDGNDTLSGSNATLDGGAGSDSLSGSGTGANTLEGGDGDDTISGGASGDDIRSGAGADRIVVRVGESSPSQAFADVIRDWSVQDTLAFANGEVRGATYVETTAVDFASALAAAKTAIASGSANFVAVAVGADVIVFADSRNDDFDPDDAVRLAGRTLDDISVSQLIAAPPLPSPPPAPGPIPSAVSGATGSIFGNMDAFQLSSLIGAEISDATPTLLVLDGDVTLSLAGSGFTYDSNDQITAGVVTGIGLSGPPGTVLQANLTFTTGFGAATLLGWVLTNQTQTAFATILSLDDNIGGGGSADLLRGYAGNDYLTGWGGADTLFGGAGDDRIYGYISPASSTGSAPGATYLRGEDGNDYIVGGPVFDDINGNMGNDTGDGGAGDDWVVGGKDNDILLGGVGNDIVYGNLGVDTCRGGDGDDSVRGGQGDDLVLGDAGNDWLSGDRGDDTVTGGAGPDIFHTFGDAGIDRVTDFDLAQGDRVQLDPETQYTVAQVGADTVISMTGGGQMILVGVAMSSLTPGWVFGA